MAQLFFRLAAACELFQAIWHIVRGLLLVALFAVTVHAATIAQPNGYYVMTAVHNANVNDSVLASPKLTGFHLRDSWDLFEAQPGVFNFSWYDSQLARAARLGKHVTLGLYAGAANDPTANSLANFTQAVAALGARYGANPLIDAVHLSSPQVTDNSMEMFVPSSWGGTDAQAITLWERSIDAYNAAFPNKVLVLDLAMAGSPTGAITKAVDEYARALLGARFNAIICSLKATTQTGASHIVELERIHGEGARIGFEFVGPSIDQARFGGSFTSALNLGKQLGGQFFQVYQQDVPNLPARTPEPSSMPQIAFVACVLLWHASRYRRAAR